MSGHLLRLSIRSYVTITNLLSCSISTNRHVTFTFAEIDEEGVVVFADIAQILLEEHCQLVKLHLHHAALFRLEKSQCRGNNH